MFLFFVVVIDNAKLLCQTAFKNGETTQWDGLFFKGKLNECIALVL